jgi:GDPmannose 4,6-dehydratase
VSSLGAVVWRWHPHVGGFLPARLHCRQALRLLDPVNYREAYGMYACNGILFNHERPIRGAKPSLPARSPARWRAYLCLGKHGRQARQWLVLQQDSPKDFVIATGVQYSVKDFVNAAAKELGMQIRWEGQGVDEKGYLVRDARCKMQVNCKMRPLLNLATGDRPIVAVDPRYFRPTEMETLLGNPAKAKDKLGWTPKISFDELVAEMVREDLKAAERDELVKKHGYKAMDYHE